MADERCGVIGLHREFPDLKPLGSDLLFVFLHDGDGVEQPIRAAVIGNVFRAVRENDITVEAVAIYPDSGGTRTNRLPKREIGILLTE
jgi:hypothetical protein